MEGDSVHVLKDSDVWLERKDHPGTKEFRRVIHRLATHSNEFSRETYNDIRSQLRGRKFVTGEHAKGLREVASSRRITIQNAFEAEQCRRRHRRRQQRRLKEEGASLPETRDRKEKRHERKGNKHRCAEGVVAHDDIENQSARNGTKRKSSSSAVGAEASDLPPSLSSSSSEKSKKSGESDISGGAGGNARDDDIPDKRWPIDAKDAFWFLVLLVLTGVAYLSGTHFWKEQKKSSNRNWTFVDPWEGNKADASLLVNDTSSQVRWPTTNSPGGGIALEILNAADDSWENWIQLSVSDWDRGDSNIDPLSLSLRRVERDIDCTPVKAKIKVCNGDYGKTEWRGINDLSFYLENNKIISSAARLNDWYLQRESDDQKLYTVCHEMGTSCRSSSFWFVVAVHALRYHRAHISFLCSNVTVQVTPLDCHIG